MNLTRPGNKSGYLVPAAMSMMGVLLVLMVASSYRGRVSTTVKVQSAADGEADNAVGNAMARMAGGISQQDIPGSVKVDLQKNFDFTSGQSGLESLDKHHVYVNVDGEYQPWQPMGTVGLYSGNNQTQVGPANGTTPWVTKASMKPTSHRREFASAFGARTYQAAMHEGFPFAAYAPGGKVELEKVRAWSNPTVKEMQSKANEHAQDQSSGLSCSVGAKTAVTVGDFKHGRVYLPKEGTLDVKGGAVALPGLPVPTNYATLIQSDIDAAYNTLKDAGIDKTGLIFGRLDVTSFIQLFKGAEFPNIFSLESALGFWFPTIPQIKNQSAWVEISFHVPLAPDQNLENIVTGLQNAPDLSTTLTQLNSAKQQLILLEQQKQAKVTERAKYASDSTEYKNLTNEIAELDTKISDKQKEINGYVDSIKGVHNGIQDSFNQGVADGTISALRSLPETTADEKAAKSKGLTKKYWTGFSYISLFVDRYADFAEIASELIGAIFDSDDFDSDVMLKLFLKEVRLVHLQGGKPSPEPSKMFQKSVSGDLKAFAIDKTWTVPRGRTFRIRTGMALKGDLWVQRGASMIIDGDLSMFSKGGLSPFEPKGRIFLEEGATLLVGGNIEGAGDSTFGSLVIGAPVGREHPINSAVICQGKVNLPYGTRTGIAFDDLARGLENEFKFSGLSEPLETVFTDILPNAAKILGPFSTRACYFSRWTTTFIIPTVFPVPIPAPIPDNKHKNQLCNVFRALTMLYTVHLNATLGENLETSTMWWLIGKERVPMVPKLDPYAVKNHIEAVVDTVKYLSANMDDVETALKTLGEDLLVHLVKDIVKDMIVEFIANQLIQGFIDGLSPIAGFVYSSTLADEVDAKINEMVDNTYGKLTDDLTSKLNLSENGSVNNLYNFLDGQLKTATVDTLLPESSGVLLYGKTGIDCGGLISSGWFVSQGNINMDSLYTVGSLISTRGNIKAKNVLYNPYFTKASLYLPEKLLPGGPGIDDLDDFWANAVNFKYGKTLHNSRGAGPKALSVGRKSCFTSAAGWSPK